MGNKEIAAELDARRQPGAVVRRLGGLKQVASLITGGGVPRSMRSALEKAFAEANQYNGRMALRKQTGGLARELKQVKAGEWPGTIKTLLPHIAPAATAAFEALTRRPYQTGISRRPFRAPRSPTTLATIRATWLLDVTFMLGEFDADIVWLAERSASLASWWGGADLGWLLAGALNRGDADSVRVGELLRAAAAGEHPVAQMGRHITQAFLSADDPRGWEYVGKLLLAAQRQEGVRQAILESVDEAHPGAFRHMLRLIREEGLTRFTATVRAADTWFGFAWDGASAFPIDRTLDHVLRFLDDPQARTAALDETDAEVVFLALWATAFEDVDHAIPHARRLLGSPRPEVRFVATHFLVQATWSSALPLLVGQLADPDLRVAARALDSFSAEVEDHVDKVELFNQIESLLKRLPKRSQVLDAIVWPWWKRKLERPAVTAALANNAKAVPGDRLLPYVPDLDPYGRARFIRRAAGLRQHWEEGGAGEARALRGAERTVALSLLGDPSTEVRQAAFEALQRTPIAKDEVDRLIDLLARKPGDLRNGALKRLSTLGKTEFLAAADTLLADPEEPRRVAGLELLRDAVESDRFASEARGRIQRYADARPASSAQEQAHTDAVLEPSASVPVRQDAFGLIDPKRVKQSPDPVASPVLLNTPAARETLESLARLVLQHQTHEERGRNGEVQHLVQVPGWNFGPTKRDELLAEAQVPLLNVWKSWLRDRPARMRDDDRCEFMRILVTGEPSPWEQGAAKEVVGLGEYGAGGRFLKGLCRWCLAWEPPAGVMPFLLSALETEIAGISRAEYGDMRKAVEAGRVHVHYWGQPRNSYDVKVSRARSLLTEIHWWAELFPAAVTDATATGVYHALRTFERKSHGYPTLRLEVGDAIAAYRAGAIGEADWIDLLIGPWSCPNGNALLRHVSSRKLARGLETYPELVELVDRCRRRLIEVECQRGDRKTEASQLVMELRYTGGLDAVIRAIAALSKSHFSRQLGYTATAASRQDSLSHVIVRSAPGAADTPERFAERARAAKISEARLVELAIFAPQWARHANQVLGWDGLESAVWWIEAHTKEDRSWQIEEMKQAWAAEVSERTPLSAANLTEGAVDVAWFGRVYAALGADRWRKLNAAAKYAATGGGHTRAQLFASAITGETPTEPLLARIDESRHQDSVRALGLVPLPDGDARSGAVLARYQRLERYRRESRKFGAQRQQSEKRAVDIALENLARTAGFRDPQRLQWAMERHAVADLLDGPVTLTVGEVTIALQVDGEGQPAITTMKNGKALKALPASLKKDPAVEELRGRYQELKRQRSRVRDTLEAAMCRGDRFEVKELQDLLRHPILAPSLQRLVFVGDGPVGYLAESGQALRDHEGRLQALSPTESLRLAHPHDLLTRGDWPAWQRECYRSERVQPFKQLFRELYPLTDTERGTKLTRRYAGHQVNPRQALALLGSRGWAARPEEGVSRTFHEEGLTARLAFQEAFYTPADIEGLTLEGVVFTRKGEWDELPLDAIPPRLFSEAMRDVDLVVSVAHQGGVDPEATASTVEMRAALVRETCDLLGLGNVEVQRHHVTITGKLATYSIHLGSAGVIVLPGTSVPIVAVHSQHRGRFFLPFADDDPRTAEVLSKILLLARDGEIKDPTILEWIRAAT